MNTQRNDVQTKAAVTVAEMARMVGLSRARFYQLVGEGVFPVPVYSVATRRPLYVEQQQRECLEVRRRHCGLNGRPVLFYAKGPSPTRPARASATPQKATATAAAAAAPEVDAEVLDVVRVIEPRATAAQVGLALRQLYPRQQQPGADDGQAMRAVALHVRRQNSADKVGG